ncbi:MAG: hypothetical protein WBJ81_00495 [Rickettsiales bacterium]
MFDFEAHWALIKEFFMNSEVRKLFLKFLETKAAVLNNIKNNFEQDNNQETKETNMTEEDKVEAVAPVAEEAAAPAVVEEAAASVAEEAAAPVAEEVAAPLGEDAAHSTHGEL